MNSDASNPTNHQERQSSDNLMNECVAPSHTYFINCKRLQKETRKTTDAMHHLSIKCGSMEKAMQTYLSSNGAEITQTDNATVQYCEKTSKHISNYLLSCVYLLYVDLYA